MAQPEIKLVVSDLDGTLLSPSQKISGEAVAVVARLNELGIGFSFATGRPPGTVEQFARQIGLGVPMICCNGAVLCDGVRALHSFSFPLAPLRGIMERAAALGLTVLCYTGEMEYALAPTAWVRTREEQGRPTPIRPLSADGWATERAVTVNIMVNEEADLGFKALRREVEALGASHSIVLYGDLGCEIMAPGADKGAGLQALCRHLQIPLENTLAIGDNTNDIPLFRVAGVAAAVANAAPEAVACADYICTHPNTLGVLEAIRRFVPHL